MWSEPVRSVFLVVSGVVAGTSGTSGGITSLVSYPALLAVGLTPFAANVTNSVAFLGADLGSNVSSRRELRDHDAPVRTWAVLVCAGALVGVALLLGTPGGVFDWAVPFLVALASVTLLLQPRIAARWDVGDQHPRLLPYGLLVIGVYNGYFGAASGIMAMTLLMLTAEARLRYANILKNALLAVADVVVAVVFVLFGPVEWSAVVPLGLGLVVGGLVGPRVAKRVPAGILRVVIGVAGLVMAGWLLVRAISGQQ